MKILVPLKRVADPDHVSRLTVAADGLRVETAGLEWKTNPFDEYALEAALRLTEDGRAPKKREGEVIVVSMGPAEADAVPLRAALGKGADRAIRVDATDDHLDGWLVAQALRSLVLEEKPDLVLMGKQSVDGESNQVGQLLAEMLDWPMATFAATILEEAAAPPSKLLVGREVDGGVLTVRVTLPAVVTVDLRIVAPNSVYSRFTDRQHSYPQGTRFAPLPAIMQAKKKPLRVVSLAELMPNTSPTSEYVRFERPPARTAGVRVTSVDELVDRLANEAKVI